MTWNGWEALLLRRGVEQEVFRMNEDGRLTA
ncbi:hypothetical protein SK3146_04740 [Paenibacillus konkukensis]|uniref:Uncharacterized protein n=1 Tax=Paenibacillus konkukensis TaxID=2020716 RepID=A0ABY4RUY7_9BACL|nr:hypothetical protein SK3146_04740 [Paenibacillus konkukensis]